MLLLAHWLSLGWHLSPNHLSLMDELYNLRGIHAVLINILYLLLMLLLLLLLLVVVLEKRLLLQMSLQQLLIHLLWRWTIQWTRSTRFRLISTRRALSGRQSNSIELRSYKPLRTTRSQIRIPYWTGYHPAVLRRSHSHLRRW